MLSHIVQRKANNMKMSERHHSVIKKSSCVMLYRPIMYQSYKKGYCSKAKASSLIQLNMAYLPQCC